MINNKSVLTLCKHPIFSDCDIEALNRILRNHSAEEITFEADEVIFSPQKEMNAIGLLLSGKAIVKTPDPTKNVLLRYLNAGDLFGIANLFTGQPYVSQIRAVSACRVLLIPASAIKALLEHDHHFMYRYISFLSGRICYLNQKIGYLTAGGAERRLAQYLCSLGENPVTLPISVSALSEVLDIGRASLYRAFDRLTEDGFVQKEGKVIHLHNADEMLCFYK